MAKKKLNKPYYLKMYYEWMEAGRLPCKGLCNSLERDKLLYEFRPPEYLAMTRMYNDSWYWGYNGENENGLIREFVCYDFTPLRQTILLFMAAMNNEL